MAKKRSNDDDDILADVKGKAVTWVFGNVPQGSNWGSTTLELTPTRVVERTKFIISERNVEILLSEVQAVEFVTMGNPVFYPLILACGLGLLLLFLFKQRYLIIRTPSVFIAVAVKGKPDAYQDFMQAVLEEAERVREGGKGKSAAPAKSARDYDDEDVAAPAPRIEAPVKNKVAAPAGDGKTTVKCPECSAEYKLPAGSTGKKFRCQKCQAVIET